jgi:hypothetical protein
MAAALLLMPPVAASTRRIWSASVSASVLPPPSFGSIAAESRELQTLTRNHLGQAVTNSLRNRKQRRFLRLYSERNASMGSTEAARRAGKNAAAAAETRSSPVTIRITVKSTTRVS